MESKKDKTEEEVKESDDSMIHLTVKTLHDNKLKFYVKKDVFCSLLLCNSLKDEDQEIKRINPIKNPDRTLQTKNNLPGERI